MGRLDKIWFFVKNSVGFLTKKGSIIDYDELHAFLYGFLEADDRNSIGEKVEYPSYVVEEQHYYLMGRELREEFERIR